MHIWPTGHVEAFEVLTFQLLMDGDAATVGDSFLTVNEVAAGCHSRRKQEKPCRVEVAANERESKHLLYI